MKNAIVLCSGGLDSTVTAYYVKKMLKYDKITILFFDYGQRTLNQEKKASKLAAKKLNAEFIEIKLSWLGKISSSLINSNKKAKKISIKRLKDTKKESDNYYVPCRNTVFLVHALALAESRYLKEKIKADIFVGFKCEGKESYPDTTKEFVREINRLGKISCSTDFKIMAPLIKKDKEDIVKLGKKLKIDLNQTFSCYIGSNKDKNIHCGTCLACRLRQAGFYWASVEDNTVYGTK